MTKAKAGAQVASATTTTGKRVIAGNTTEAAKLVDAGAKTLTADQKRKIQLEKEIARINAAEKTRREKAVAAKKAREAEAKKLALKIKEENRAKKLAERAVTARVNHVSKQELCGQVVARMIANVPDFNILSRGSYKAVAVELDAAYLLANPTKKSNPKNCAIVADNAVAALVGYIKEMAVFANAQGADKK